MNNSLVEQKLDRLINDIAFVKSRMSSYLGGQEALGYLVDETPIFVNTNDIGCPINVLNGGRYEEDYLSILASYRRRWTTVLDVGANLGIYSLRMASMCRTGRILAFEPISRIRNLFARSVYLNNFSHIIDIQPFALSDTDGEVALSIPAHHAGGASLDGGDGRSEFVQVRTLDQLVDGAFTCDLVKLDVEGHEHKALKGMMGVLRRSPSCVVLFEKLLQNSGSETEILRLCDDLGWGIYAVDRLRLSRVGAAEFLTTAGYFIAGRPVVVEDGGLDRGFLDVFPSDLNVLAGQVESGWLKVAEMPGKGGIIFHGPYWYLPKGFYRLEFDGEISGGIIVTIAEQFGYRVEDLKLNGTKPVVEFPVNRDLCKFELVCRSTAKTGSMALHKIRLTRMA
ncbi:FkbM family methyltransferase [Aestuariivirga sp.]|uniref:FkbM family methyltransferase n=1 Tax=Aestuariivirga sp. TaxID=2650926 RepID=UPI00378401A3